MADTSEVLASIERRQARLASSEEGRTEYKARVATMSERPVASEGESVKFTARGYRALRGQL